MNNVQSDLASQRWGYVCAVSDWLKCCTRWSANRTNCGSWDFPVPVKCAASLSSACVFKKEKSPPRSGTSASLLAQILGHLRGHAESLPVPYVQWALLATVATICVLKCVLSGGRPCGAPPAEPKPKKAKSQAAPVSKAPASKAPAGPQADRELAVEKKPDLERSPRRRKWGIPPPPTSQRRSWNLPWHSVVQGCRWMDFFFFNTQKISGSAVLLLYVIIVVLYL